jgi:hypothetical protein
MKFTLLLIICIFVFSNNIYTQFLSGKNSQVLVKGIVKDDNTNEPLGVSIELRGSDGKKLKTQSNSLTGLFEQLLPADMTYSVILNSDDIIRKEFEFKTDTATQFKEQEVEWTAIKPLPGAKIFSGAIFINDDSQISDLGESRLQEIQLLLRFNRSLYVVFEVAGDNALYMSRIDVLKNKIESWTREKSRIEYKSSQNKSNSNDLLVKITKIEDFLKK